MLCERLKSNLRVLAICGTVVAIALLGLAQGSDDPIDLDEDSSNGEESTVRAKVLQSSPIVVENVIFNNADGQSFRFYWSGAGPHGFNSQVTAGPDVGAKWTWSTVSQLYTITSPVRFVDDSHEIAAFGGSTTEIHDDTLFDSGLTFDVSGKSIFLTEVTLSSAVLTSSLITFFSPEVVQIEFISEYENGIFTTTALNHTGENQMVELTEPDCCKFPEMTICGDGCKFYLTDTDNCGGCGNPCEEFEVCVDGVCEPEAPSFAWSSIRPRLTGGENRPVLGFRGKSVQVRGVAAGLEGGSRSVAAVDPDDVVALRGESLFASAFTPVTAELCEAVQIEEEIPAGGSTTVCQYVPVLPKEVFTTATISFAGFHSSGPVPQFVPDLDAVIGPLTPASCGIFIDDGLQGDGLWQPCETADVFFCVDNLGTEPLTNVGGSVSAPQTSVNPVGIPFSVDTSPFPDLPGFAAGDFDCDNPPPDPVSVQNLVGFTGMLDCQHPADTGHPLILTLTGDVGAPGGTVSEDVTFIVGIGEKCDPETDLDGRTYDGVAGFFLPVDVHLVPIRSPVNFSSQLFSKTEPVPLATQLYCDQPRHCSDFDFGPEIVSLEHETLGPILLQNINANGPDPDNPFFGCSESDWNQEYSLNTADLPLGRIVIAVKMPDSRVFHAGIEIVE